MPHNTGLASLTVGSKHYDPALNALFSSSAGPVTRPSKSRYVAQTLKSPSLKPQSRPTESGQGFEESTDDVESKEPEAVPDHAFGGDDRKSTANFDGDFGATLTEQSTANTDLEASSSRKRKRKANVEDLEERYLSKLMQEEENEQKREAKKLKSQKGISGDKDDAADNSSEHSSEQCTSIGADEYIPVHESVAVRSEGAELEKSARTVFLANVSTEAVTSKSAKRTLLAHLATILDTSVEPLQKVESIRFRSLAFSSTSLPKRAAYITGALMDATTQSTNAYAVYSDAAAARKAVGKLNGTEVLGRHLRVDSVAHPSQTDHRRCVFVGNLGFVDDETVLNQNADGETKSKKRYKVPADVEEGLWRVFSAEGRRVENVRVIRDSQTRVGKGIAYVQFYDGNDVESALLLNDKKYPPMLPRPLRVTRAKAPHKTALAMERAKAKMMASNSGSGGKPGKSASKFTHRDQSMLGRAEKLLGRSVVQSSKRREGHTTRYPPMSTGSLGLKLPEDFVVEGRRASAQDGPLMGMKVKRKLSSKKATGPRSLKRGGRRAKEWRKAKESK